MSKAYLMVLRVVALIVTFVLGMLTAVAGMVGAGVFATTGVSLDKLAQFGINIDTSELFDESEANTSIRGLTVLDFIKEIKEVASISETATLDYLSDEYGLILPPEGEVKLLDVLRVMPFSVLFSQDGFDEATSNIYFGEIFGFERREEAVTPDEENGDTQLPENTPQNPPVNDDQGTEDDGVVPTALIVRSESGEDTEPQPAVKYVWYNPETDQKINGIEALLYDHTLYEFFSGSFRFTDLLDEIKIGDVIGLKNVDGEWYESNGELAHGIKAAIADQTVNTLESSFETVTVGELMDYASGADIEGKNENKWYTKNDSGEWEEVTGIMAVMAPKHLGDLDTALEDVKVGEVMGYTLGSETDYAEAEADKWYKKGADGNWEEVTGIMGVMSAKYINDMDGALDNELMGDLLGYVLIPNPDWSEENDSVDKEIWAQYITNESGEKELQPVDSLMNAVANTTFNNVGHLRTDLTLGDVVGKTECKYVNLIGRDTHVDKLSERADEVFETSSMGDFVEAGLIEFDNDEDGSKKEKFLRVYGDHNMNEFVDLALQLADKADQIPFEN